MTHDELVEKVAGILYGAAFTPEDFHETADKVITTIREELQDPNEDMLDAAWKIAGVRSTSTWRAMLAASPLASTTLRESS